MKQVTRQEFFSLFDPSVHEALDRALALPGTDGLVCYENVQMDSSHFGNRAAVTFGPARDWAKTPEEAWAKRLGDVPSRFKYPQCYMLSGA